MAIPTAEELYFAPATGPALSDDQVEHFKEKGYVVVANLVDDDTLDRWRAQLSDRFGPLEQASTWDSMKDHFGSSHEGTGSTLVRDPDGPEQDHLHRQPGVVDVISHLGGGHFGGYTDNPHVTWPTPDRSWPTPERGHIDGYARGVWFSFMMGSTMYLHDVAPQGGGTVFWPGSHKIVRAYFENHPGSIETGLPGDFAANYLSHITPIEMTAAAGTVVFWHGFLYHNRSLNCSKHPRIAWFARYLHDEQDVIRGDLPDDPWKYWGI